MQITVVNGLTVAALGLRGVPACLLAATAVVTAAQKPGDLPASLPVTSLSGPQSAQLPPPATPSAPSQQPPSMPVTELDERARGSNLDTPRHLSITLSSPAPIRDLLLLLVRDTVFSVAVDSDVQGTFLGELKDVTLRQALESILGPRDLDYDVTGTLIHVFRRQTEMRLFELNFLAVHRASQRTIRGSSGVDRMDGDGSSLSTSAGDGDLFDELATGIGTLLSAAGRVHIDRRAGVAQVTDYPGRLDKVGLYVETVHLRLSRQVRLQARVLEVTLGDKAPSIDWRAVREKLGLPPNPAPSAGFAFGDADAAQEALAAQGSVRVLAAPDVVAMNNEPAIMRVGTQDVSFVTRVSARNREHESHPIAITEGLMLTVVAQISADGMILLSVSPSWTERNGQQRSAAGDVAPVLNVSEADSVMRVADGNTVLVSGFLRSRQGSLAATGVKGFFGAQQSNPVNAELVVLLTPTVVTPGTFMGPRAR